MPSRADQQERIWYGATEVAKYLGVHPNTIKRIPEGDLPFMRYGTRGDRRYHKDDIGRYVNKRMVGR